MPWLEESVDRAIADLASAHLLRTPKVIESVRGPFVTIGGRKVLSFCSNDYLGLSQHEAQVSALMGGLGGFAWGAGSSRLMAGTSIHHRKLEKTLAWFLGTEAALVFSSGAA
ncbi:MAG TPA: aminotransferase class I/II-fold pyridoxal phosphate-dependent enzyme, partial [Planctomycetota bacterium]|nr:aminotransferase class I/II-fold pyridoxal phosphate-dependent enzyme [Planctomycetota bacterium]